MMYKFSLMIFGLCLGFISFTTPNFAQATELKPDDLLPVDKKITIGKLENGLKYYIRENGKPEKRAELRLAVNIGSILEDEDQLGLAHFVEHMAFNGTKNFAKQEIIDYLESIGMRFGPDINAYTSFDETVYMLQIPTDSLDALKMGFRILAEWAHNVTFDGDEIDKERGVVVEEWRSGRGATARMRDKQFPVILKDSRYAERLPIGKPEILQEAPYATLKRFYHDWYRPDLMAVVAVGDFDKNWIETQIKDYFSSIPGASSQRERKFYEVPAHEETFVTIASDPEAVSTQIVVYYKLGEPKNGTAGAYRQSLISLLYNSMFSDRLNELLQTEDPPFLAGFSQHGSFIRTSDVYLLGAVVNDAGTMRGLASLLSSAEQVKRYGFTDTELQRKKQELLRNIERAYNERDKSVSQLYADEYIRNFLTGESIPGIEYELELYKKFLPGIGLGEVNAFTDSLIRDKSRVVALSAPDNPDVTLPTETEIMAVFDMTASKKIDPYEDKVSDLPLVENPPNPGQIVEEKEISELGVTEWVLSNGVKVVLKPTDFKNDQVLFTSFSPGGHSLVADANYVPAISSSAIIREAGLGSFDQIALQKKLSGKIVSVMPFINELEEGIAGSAAQQDLETAFELIYLYFTAPRVDETAYKSFKKRMIDFIKNRHVRPEAAFGDTIQVTMSNGHFRRRPWSAALFEEMNMQRSFRIYQDRFADASDFTFIFVGNFDLPTVKPLVERYLGGLPNVGREEKWKDIGIKSPQGVIKKEVRKGLEPKSQVSIIFTGPMNWTRQDRYELRSMAGAFQIKLREIIREDKGGTYGVSVSAATSRFPQSEYSLHIRFGCAPDRVEELTASIFSQIDSLQDVGLTEKYLTKIKETQRRKRELDLKENRFWLNSLRATFSHNLNPLLILEHSDLVQGLTLDKIQKAAQRYFDLDNFVQVALYPEGS